MSLHPHHLLQPQLDHTNTFTQRHTEQHIEIILGFGNPSCKKQALGSAIRQTITTWKCVYHVQYDSLHA